MLGLQEINEVQEQKILQELSEAAELHLPFMVLMGSSSVIATFGMLLNSPAVVIGAMLVAPLMTPIFSLSVSLIRGRVYLMRRALTTEFIGVAIAILLAVLIGLVVPEPELTTEILARTKPTLFDLAVALAAGLAGSFALVREEVSPALPGVAIAVALLPPLAAVGLGLSMRRLDVAGGALVLFLANFVAIHLVSAAVFYLHGLAHHLVERNPRLLLKNFGAALVVLVIMVVFLGVQLAKLVHEGRISRTARTTLEQQVRMIDGAMLTEVNINCQIEPCRIVATVETPEVFEPPLVRGIQNVLKAQMGSEVELSIRSVALREASAAGFHFGASTEEAETEPTEERREEPAQSASTTPKAVSLEVQIQQLLAQQAAMVPGAELLKFSYDGSKTPVEVVATYRSEVRFGEALENGIANLLRNRLGTDVKLEVQYLAPLPTEPKPEAEPVPQGALPPAVPGLLAAL